MCIYIFICFLLFSNANIIAGQGNSLTFTPSIPLCIGEEVRMVCFVVPPTAQQFIDSTALISFDGSDPAATPARINANSVGGVDTTRYTADTTGLTTSTSRPGVRLTISDYQESDGAITFGCHGLYSGIVPSPVVISNTTQGLAAPPSPPPSLTASFSSQTCSGTVELSWTPGASDRTIDTYFLYLNGAELASVSINSYSHVTTLQRDTDYSYSVAARSCAGNSTRTDSNVISAGDPLIINENIVTPKSNITDTSTIYPIFEHDLDGVDKSETVTYNITLHINETSTDTLYQVPYNQVNLSSFATKFTFDTYYRISVTGENCAGGSGSATSKTFVLLGLRPDTGRFQESSSNPDRIEWVYTSLITPQGGFEDNYLSKDYFTLLVLNLNDSSINYTITDFNLYLPHRFDFYLPSTFDTSSGDNVINILFNGELLANVAIIVQKTSSNAVTIILIILFVLLAILFAVILSITLAFVIIFFYKKRGSKD